jgi:hypothetical protein
MNVNVWFLGSERLKKAAIMPEQHPGFRSLFIQG